MHYLVQVWILGGRRAISFAACRTTAAIPSQSTRSSNQLATRQIGTAIQQQWVSKQILSIFEFQAKRLLEHPRSLRHDRYTLEVLAAKCPYQDGSISTYTGNHFVYFIRRVPFNGALVWNFRKATTYSCPTSLLYPPRLG